MRLVVAFALIVTTSSSMAAQASSPDSVAAKLVAAKSLRCEFGPGVMTKWVSGRPVTQPADSLTGDFRVAVYDAIDLSKGSAHLIGNLGAGDVAVIPSSVGVTFLDIRPPLFDAVTVFAKLVKPLEFAAADSRHFRAGDAVLVEQFFGSCRVWE